MNLPLISIIICCYNRAHYLRQTMESVFSQKYDPVEIVVVDDGSTDETREIMASYGNKIRYIRQENQGIAVARNTGCRHAKGVFIAFQDDDDLMPPNRITHLYNALQNYPTAVFATGDIAIIDTEGNLTGRRHKPLINIADEGKVELIDKSFDAVMWPTVPVAPHTTLFKKSDGEKIGWHDTQLAYACEDKDFFARLSKLGPIVYVREIVSYLRRGHPSLSSNVLKSTYYRLRLYEKHINDLGSNDAVMRERLKQRLTWSFISIASYESKGLVVDDEILKGYFNKSYSTIGAKGRIKYKWHKLIKYPLRNIIQRSH